MDHEATEWSRARLPEPLTHTNSDGHVYQRLLTVEQQVRDALELDRGELESRCQVRDERSPDFLKEESLVYLIRYYRRSGNSFCVDILSESLLSRCAASTHRSLRSLDEDAAEEAYSEVVEQLFTQIFDLESDRGDFLQVRFRLALKRIAVETYRTHLARLKRERENLPLTSLAGYDGEDTDELAPNVIVPTPTSATSRSAESEFIENHVIQAAVNQLTEPVRAAYLLRYRWGWPIEDQDPAVPTISSHFNRTPRTIRNWLAKAKKCLAAWSAEWR